MNRMLKVSLLLTAALALTACGFHLRRSAALPPSMQRVHLTVNGGGDLARNLARALSASGVTVEGDAGAGIAELNVPVAQFGSNSLSINGAARITEYAVSYHVEFDVKDGSGQPLIPRQHIDMSREYSYDATNTVGSAAQVQELQRSLNDDMVQAILFRLQAAAKHPVVTNELAPAPAASTH